MVTLFSICHAHKDDNGVLQPAFAPFDVSRRLAERIRSRDRRVFTLQEFEDYVSVGKHIRRTALNGGAPEYVADDPEACAEWLLGKAGLVEQAEPVAAPGFDDGDEADLRELTNEELREMLAAQGKVVRGAKTELIARLLGEEE